MSEEKNEVLEQQRYLLECRMYRLDPAPPKLPAQEYIVRYLTEKEEKYLAWYLHDQEPALNKLAQAACERYAMAEHFADIKQAAVCGILAALQKYDPAVGAPFAAFQKRYIQDGVGDYIRTAQSGVITMTADTYPVMRRIMAIYHLNGDDCSDSCIQRIADETGMGEKSVRKYITIGTLNERRVDFYRQYDEDGEETAEDISVDTTSQPDKMYFRAVLYDALHQAYTMMFLEIPKMALSPYPDICLFFFRLFQTRQVIVALQLVPQTVSVIKLVFLHIHILRSVTLNFLAFFYNHCIGEIFRNRMCE